MNWNNVDDPRRLIAVNIYRTADLRKFSAHPLVFVGNCLVLIMRQSRLLSLWSNPRFAARTIS